MPSTPILCIIGIAVILALAAVRIIRAEMHWRAFREEMAEAITAHRMVVEAQMPATAGLAAGGSAKAGSDRPTSADGSHLHRGSK